MAIKIGFDSQNNPEQPTLVLATRNGRLLGKLQTTSTQTKDALNGPGELRFDVYKQEKITDKQLKLWESIVDFKTLWAREWNTFFEIYVETEEDSDTVKHITATSLGEAELSQIILYNIEVNTEDDIAREDYEPTVLFDNTNASRSLLNRLLEKAPHYTIKHVDVTIKNLQRSFSFDGKSIYDAFMEISEKCDCLFVIKCYLDSNRVMKREISVYDLLSYCSDCGYRGSYTGTCPECGGTNIIEGYGEDTTIFINSENLANSITYTTDNGSVKNCFKLKCGDDYMTAAVAACNPNGSPYIYYITDDVKADMSSELAAKINQYNQEYDYCQNTHAVSMASSPGSTLRQNYNNVITKYSSYTTDYSSCPSSIVGYTGLMQLLFETIGFGYFLNHELMPTVTIPTTNAATELAKVTASNIGYVGVKSLSGLSVSTANSAVLQMVKTIIDGRYNAEISGTPTLTSNTTYYTWSGQISVTSYSDETDTATHGSAITLYITSDSQTYLNNCLKRALNNKSTDEITDMVSLFALSNSDFETELGKYGLVCLNSIHDACQSCVDILIAQGVADGSTWGTTIYNTLYANGYYAKLGLIEAEIKEREADIAAVQSLNDYLIYLQNQYHEYLDFENYLGTTLFLEFCTYRREDTYQNDNYISDGLSDAEVFANAMEFLQVARNEIKKSAELQHSINANLKNLLSMKEFSPIVDYFEVGNWLRVRIDGKIYKLRLLDYSVDFDNIDDLSVTFSDVICANDSISDIESILNSASSMASSYDSVKHQAKKGNISNEQLENWVEKGLSLTTMKIVNNADNQDVSWDEHGILCREYVPYTDSYDDEQIKIINKGLYYTNNNWVTSKAGIGSFIIWNPVTGQNETKYGVIADTIVGRIILGENVYIANTANTFSVDTNGLTVSNGTNSVSINPGANYLFDIKKGSSHLLYLDTNGNLNVTGNITANSLTLGNNVLIPTSNVSGISAYFDSNGVLTAGTVADGSNGFTVSSNGLLQASNAVIYGTIYSSAGTIGGWNINSDSLSYSKTYNGTTYSINLRPYSTSSSYGAIWIAQGNTYPFRVDYDGTLTATKANITGSITASSGSLGGFTISSTSNTGTSASGGHCYTSSLYAQSGDGTYEYEVGLKGDGNSQTDESGYLAFYVKRITKGSTWASPTTLFYVTKGGSLYASDADIAGKITSNSGKIGGWSLMSGYIYRQSTAPTTSGTQYETYLAAPDSISGSSTAIAIRSRTYTNGTAGSWAYPFYVTYDGSLYSTKGSIGGWNISDTMLYRDVAIDSTYTNRTYMYAPSTITINSSAAFGVAKYSSNTWEDICFIRHDGYFYAKNAYIEGTIKSSSATITGGSVKISTNGEEEDEIEVYYRQQESAVGKEVHFYNRFYPKGITMYNNLIRTGGNYNNSGTWSKYQSGLMGYWVNGYDTQGEVVIKMGISYTATATSASSFTDAYRGMFQLRKARGGSSTTEAPLLVEICEGSTYCGYIGVHDTDGNTRAYLTGDTGYCGVLNASGYYTAYMRGDTGACYAYSYNNLSDRSKKKNITYLDPERAANRINRFRAARFQYIDGDDKYHHGIIAQDAEEVMDDPEWGLVNYTSESPEMIARNHEMQPLYKTIAYTELIADLIAGFQYQQQEIELLKQQLAAMTA